MFLIIGVQHGLAVCLFPVDAYRSGRLALSALGDTQDIGPRMRGGFHHFFQGGDSERIRYHEVVALVLDTTGQEQQACDKQAYFFHHPFTLMVYQPGFWVKLVISASWVLPKGKR